MDLIFTCPDCRQELETDASGSGTEIECPECGSPITIPEATPQNIRALPVTNSAAGQVERHLTLPSKEKRLQVKIEKPRPTLDMEGAKTADEKNFQIKCFKRMDCLQNGNDQFEKIVGEFLRKIGPANVVSVHPLHYSRVDSATNQILQDYGVMVFYKD